MYNKGF